MSDSSLSAERPEDRDARRLGGRERAPGRASRGRRPAGRLAAPRARARARPPSAAMTSATPASQPGHAASSAARGGTSPSATTRTWRTGRRGAGTCGVGHRPDRTARERRRVPGRSCTLGRARDAASRADPARRRRRRSRKGVTLDVHVFAESTHTAEDAAAAVGAELGQIVKSLVFVAPAGGRRPRADPVPGVRTQPRRPRPPRRRDRRARRPARDRRRGAGADRLHHRRHPAHRPPAAGARGHGPGPRAASRWCGPPPARRPPCSRCRRPRCGCCRTRTSPRSARSAARRTSWPRAPGLGGLAAAGPERRRLAQASAEPGARRAPPRGRPFPGGHPRGHALGGHRRGRRRVRADRGRAVRWSTSAS